MARPTPHPAGLHGPRPVLLAHRGGGSEVPENSPAAVARLAELGVDFLETDVHASADGVVVVTHDETLERTTDGAGRVRDHTWAELATLRNEAGEGLQRLDELLAAYPTLKVNIDAKAPTVVQPLADILAEGAVLQRVCLASFSTANVRRLRRLLGPRAATSLGSGEVAVLLFSSYLFEPLGRMVRMLLPRTRRHKGRVVSGAVCVQVPLRTRGIRIVSPAFIRAAHDRGLAVHVWTINDVQTARRLLEMGVDGIVTDVPSELAPLFQHPAQA